MNVEKRIDSGFRSIPPDEVYTNKGVIMNVGRRLGLDYNSREDLVQEVAFKCFSNPKIRFNLGKASLASYLSVIARNTAVNMWRKNKHLPIFMEDMEVVLRIDAEAHDAPEAEFREERIKRLKEGIRMLYRQYPSKIGNDAFLLFVCQGLSARQVANRLGVQERFVNVAVHRGIRRLKEIVRQLEVAEKWQQAC